MLGGRIIPLAIIGIPVMVWAARDVWQAALVFLALGMVWLAYEISTAPTLDEAFPLDDRLPAGGPEDGAVDGKSGRIAQRDRINFNATETHEVLDNEI